MTALAPPEARDERARELREALVLAAYRHRCPGGNAEMARTNGSLGWAAAQVDADRFSAVVSPELDALRRWVAESKAPITANDAELDADPQLLIRHLEQQCRDFIRERDEWKAVANREAAERDAATACATEAEARASRYAVLLQPLAAYAAVALPPEGIDGEIGERIVGALRRSISTVHLRNILAEFPQPDEAAALSPADPSQSAEGAGQPKEPTP